MNGKFERDLEKFRKFLDSQKYVLVSYLFGSFSKGKTGPLSDIDIGIFADESLTKKELIKRKMIIMDEAVSIFGKDRVDVVLMNSAPLSLNFNIIRDGRSITHRDINKKVTVEADIMSRYLDRKFYDNIYLKNGMKRVLRRGLS